MRATRHLLRRRCYFMRDRAALLPHIQSTASQYLLPTCGKNIAYQANRTNVAEQFANPAVRKNIKTDRQGPRRQRLLPAALRTSPCFP
jgi:hypothetical protein